MSKTLGPWTALPGEPHCIVRTEVGASPSQAANRYALIEKTPRVRIRPDFCRLSFGSWPEHLDWCEGPKGSSAEQMPDGSWQYDEASKQWCDRVLKALGHELIGDTSG